MAFYINAKCTSCKACATVCPTASIFYGVNQYVIDADTCEECKVCVSVCPEGAIHPLNPPKDSAEDEW